MLITLKCFIGYYSKASRKYKYVPWLFLSKEWYKSFFLQTYVNQYYTSLLIRCPFIHVTLTYNSGWGSMMAVESFAWTRLNRYRNHRVIDVCVCVCDWVLLLPAGFLSASAVSVTGVFEWVWPELKLETFLHIPPPWPKKERKAAVSAQVHKVSSPFSQTWRGANISMLLDNHSCFKKHSAQVPCYQWKLAWPINVSRLYTDISRAYRQHILLSVLLSLKAPCTV